MPAARRIGSITSRVQAGSSPSPEDLADLRRLQTRLARASNTAAVLLVLALMAMAVARYVP
jgi:hypothetical protein